MTVVWAIGTEIFVRSDVNDSLRIAIAIRDTAVSPLIIKQSGGSSDRITSGVDRRADRADGHRGRLTAVITQPA